MAKDSGKTKGSSESDTPPRVLKRGDFVSIGDSLGVVVLDSSCPGGMRGWVSVWFGDFNDGPVIFRAEIETCSYYGVSALELSAGIGTVASNIVSKSADELLASHVIEQADLIDEPVIIKITQGKRKKSR